MMKNEMNRLPTTPAPGQECPGVSEANGLGDKRGASLLDKFDRAMSKRVTNKREQAEAGFRELFPRLLAHQRNGRTLKELLAAFNTATQGKVCNKTFKAMFELEAQRHDENGLLVHCISCDQPLPYRRNPLTGQQLEGAHD